MPGRAAVFCRFSSCNLWTGREQDRGRAICQFCDTDFVGTDGVGGGKYATAADLAAKVRQHVGPARGCSRDGPSWCAPGANPCCNWTRPRSEAFHASGFEVAVETNGTQKAPKGLDWICVSPKAGAPLQADERR